MEENESMQGKSLSKELKDQDKIKQAIQLAILNDKTSVSLEDGISTINLDIYKAINEDGKYIVSLAGNTVIAEATRTEGGVKFDYYNSQVKEKIPSQFDIDSARIRMAEEQRKELSIQKNVEQRKDVNKLDLSDKDKQTTLKRQIEEGGYAVKMDLDREFSSSENMRMFIKRAWGIDAQDAYRVPGPGNDPHNFKYIAKTTNANEPYKEIPLSTNREGRNNGQKIWLLEDGVLKEKTVDSLMIKGNYAIATDIPDSVMSGHTRTYLVSRTYKGRYLAVAAEEKSGVNRSSKTSDAQKGNMQRGKSLWEIEDVIESAMLAERIGVLVKDKKLTAEEVEMVKKLKVDRNMDDEEVIDTINAVSVLKEFGYNEKQIAKALETFKEIPKDKKIDEMIDKEEQREEKGSVKTIHDDHDEEERILGPKHMQ